jgi:endonuclease YncB( thermonuclease family)
VSKPWKPGRQTVELRPSRIRREPVRLQAAAAAVPRSRERELRMVAIGVVLVAAALAGLVVGVSEVTSHRQAAAPVSAAFGHCHTSAGPNCVLDGGTFYLAGQKIAIAGLDAPQMHPSRCAQEARIGTDSAVMLRELLNRGPVTLINTGPDRDGQGRLLRKVEVKGVDVATVMIDAGVARELGAAGPRNWCERPDEL